MNSNNISLSDQALLLLEIIKKSSLKTDITGPFVTLEYLKLKFGKEDISKAKEALKELKAATLIKKVESSSGAYQLTPEGEFFKPAAKVVRPSEYDKAVMAFIKDNSPTSIDDILDEFGIDQLNEVYDSVEILKELRYIKMSDIFLGFVPEDSDTLRIKDDDIERWELSYLGRNFLSGRSTKITSYSHITNSNIAHQSPNAIQSININDLGADIRKKILEFDEAASRKDSAGMKKAFGYIADKAVDVAIALGTGTLLR